MARRSFSSRPVRNETEHSQHTYPSEGHPDKGIPAYPDPLPGEHHYTEHDETPEGEMLDVGPAKPYYDAGMSHGVPSDIHYGGRPAPIDEDRTREAANHPADERHVSPHHDPIPVVIVKDAGGIHPTRQQSLGRKFVNAYAAGQQAIPLVDKDPSRKYVYLLNEGPASTGGIRLTEGPSTDVGPLLPGGMTSYQRFTVQDELFAQADSGNTAGGYVSIICEFDRMGT